MPTAYSAANSGPIPATAGIGLRSPHCAQIIAEKPAVGWLEVHSENYFSEGGMHLERLMSLRSHYPLSLHGVGLSLGSTDPINREHLRKLKRLADRCEPAVVSEHLSWSSVDDTFLNDLLPLPMTEETLRHMVGRVREAQDYLGRPLLIENPSSYLRFQGDQLAEWEFLAQLAVLADCFLLVDINNIYVSARNNRLDTKRYLASLPRDRVRELHLAGHSKTRVARRELLIDTHSTPVCDDVWSLYQFALECFGAVPTLVEWDVDIPPLEVLLAEAAKANRCLERVHDLAA